MAPGPPDAPSATPDDDAAAKLKQEGNDRLKAGDDRGALELYSKALEVAAQEALRSQLHSNSAHVLLKLQGREEEALAHCDLAFRCDPSNVKACFRGAAAASRLQRHGAAVEYCSKGLKLDAENKDLRALLKKSKAKAAFAKALSDSDAPKADVGQARREKAEGDRLFGEDEASAALERYDATLQALGEAPGAGDAPESAEAEGLRREALDCKARCHLELGEWWPAVMAAERASLYCEDQPAAAAVCEGRALRELGLMHTAEEKFRRAARRGASAPPGGSTPSCSSTAEAEEEHHAVLAALQSVEDGDMEAVMQEVERLRKALPEKEAANWMYTVKVRCDCDEGRREMLGNGFLKPEWLELPQASYTSRCMQKLLLYQVKKKLQQELSLLPQLSTRSGPKGSLAVSYTFASPSSLRHPNAPLLLRDRHIEELQTRGLTVIDQAFDEAAMASLRGECEWLDKTMGILRSDKEDICNPLQRSFDIPLSDKERVQASRKDTPVLFEVIDHLRGLPALLEERLGLQLRVPETVMLACYPKGAFYRRHLDSYEGKDIPRKVTILLYCNPDWTPGDGGALRAWLGDEVVEFEPRAGRIIVFMAQDVWHEVTESQKERYALTQWVWDVKKDSLGRSDSRPWTAMARQLPAEAGPQAALLRQPRQSSSRPPSATLGEGLSGSSPWRSSRGCRAPERSSTPSLGTRPSGPAAGPAAGTGP